MELLRRIKAVIIGFILSCYGTYLRPLVKFLQSKFFGVHEVERKVLVGDLIGLSIYNFSIRNY